jgi:hypothetical protein
MVIDHELAMMDLPFRAIILRKTIGVVSSKSGLGAPREPGIRIR